MLGEAQAQANYVAGSSEAIWSKKKNGFFTLFALRCERQLRDVDEASGL